MTITLSKPEVQHLITILRWTDNEGCYYGNKAHFVKRQERLLAKLILAEDA